MTIPTTCPHCHAAIELELLRLNNTTERCPECRGYIKITISTWQPASRPPQPSPEALAKVAA